MQRTWKALRALVVALTLAAGVLVAPARAMADKLHLKDGRVLEGTVSREVEGYVWFKFKVGGLESEQMFKPDEIKTVERDAGTPAEPAATAPKTEEKPAEAAPGKFGVPRVAIITLGEGGDKDMVGIYMTSEQLKRMIPQLEAEKIDTVVFRINSGGGMLLEIQKLSDVIHNEYKPRFRVAAWIEYAISAAAMTSHCIEEIYFMPQGSYGACTGWSGALTAVKGRQLEEVLYMMEKISARGNHDPKIMRSMQIMEPLSCTIDSNGDVQWYQNTSGENLVNPEGRILTFNALDAEKFKFSRGTASTYQELGKKMGFAEVQWVGKMIPGVSYPVCRAEEDNRRFRAQVHDDEGRTREYFIQWNAAYQLAAGSPPEDRGKFIAKCRQALDNIKRMVKNNPNFALLVFGAITERQWRDWVEEREEELRRLTRR